MKPEEIASQLIALVETGNLAEAERRLSGITDAELQALPLLRMWEAFRKHAFKAGEVRVARVLILVGPSNLSYRVKAAETFTAAGFASLAAEQLEAAIGLPDCDKKIQHIASLAKKLDQPDILKKILDHGSTESCLGAEQYVALQFHTAKCFLARRRERAMYELLATVARRQDLIAERNKEAAKLLLGVMSFREPMDFLRDHFSLSPDEMDEFFLNKVSLLIGQNAKDLAARELAGFAASAHSADNWQRCSGLYLRINHCLGEAVMAQKRAVSLAPRNGELRANLADCHVRNSSPFLARVQLYIAYLFCRHTVETLRRSSEVAVQMRLPRLASWFARRECRRSSGSPASRIRLAYINSILGNLRDVESAVPALLGELRSGTVGDSDAWVEILAVLSRLRRYEQHDDILDQALKKFPRSRRIADLSRARNYLGQTGAVKKETV